MGRVFKWLGLGFLSLVAVVTIVEMNTSLRSVSHRRGSSLAFNKSRERRELFRQL